MKDDIHNIITGNISTVNDLSAGADKVNSAMYGSYPAAIYTRVNGTTYTYSKVHNDATTSKTHYFRLNYSATQLGNISLAQSYTSGTDTLVNSSVSPTLNIGPTPYSSFLQNGLDIVVSNKLIAFFGLGVLLSINDMGHNSTTRTYTNSMLMMTNDWTNLPQWGTLGTTTSVSTGGVVPYTYLYSTSSYGSLTSSIAAPLVYRLPAGNGATLISENPLFFTAQGANNLIYGAYRLPPVTFNGTQIYKDSSNAYRLTSNDISLLVD